MESIIALNVTNSKSYQEYRTIVTQLVEQNLTSGNDTSEAMVNYTMLNDRRMKRWDKTIKVSDEVKERVSNFKGDITWLVLTESWCGDAAHVVPAINKIAELSDNIDLKLVFRDENEELMNQFLTNGSKSIPKLIMVDNTTLFRSLSGEVINTFGPRPNKATQLVNDYKAKYGTLTPEFKEELQHWYNTDKGLSTINDLLNLLGV